MATIYPYSHTRPNRNKRRPRRKFKTSILFAAAGMVGIIAWGTIYAANNVKSFSRSDAALTTIWKNDRVLGVKTSQIMGIQEKLLALKSARTAGIPSVYLGKWGPIPAEVGHLKTQSRMLVIKDRPEERLTALHLGAEIVDMEGRHAPFSSFQVAGLVTRAQSLTALSHLIISWRADIGAWQQSILRLTLMGGGLEHGQPVHVVKEMDQLKHKLATAGSYWQGIVPAQDSLHNTQAYLAAPPTSELSGYQSIMAEMQSALAGIKPLPAGDPFGKAFHQYLATRSSFVSITVYNAKTGRSYTDNPGVEFDTASIVKPTILSTLLWQSQKSGNPLTDAEQDLAVPMIEESSNDAASSLWNDAGHSAGIQKFLDAAGLRQTHPGKGGMWGLTQTTATDQVDLLKLLSYPNAILTPSSQAYVRNLMENVTSWEDWGVSSGPVYGTTVALKNGWLPIGADGWEINSIGHVDGDGRNYVVAVLTRDNPTESYGIQTISEISKFVWHSQQP